LLLLLFGIFVLTPFLLSVPQDKKKRKKEERKKKEWSWTVLLILSNFGFNSFAITLLGEPVVGSHCFYM
jgi:hypothetical protein